MAFIFGLWNKGTSTNIEESKKNDDFGKGAIEKWKRRNPENLPINYVKLEQINDIAIKILDDLETTLTTSNFELVKNHLINLSMRDDLLRKAFMKYLDDHLKADKKIKIDIKDKLNSICAGKSLWNATSTILR